MARLTAMVLIFVSVRAWRREVPERLLGKTFWVCSAVSVTYALILALWHLRIVHAAR